jgi:hypothetical protein
VGVAGVAEGRDGRPKWMTKEFCYYYYGGRSEDSFRDRRVGDGRKGSVCAISCDPQTPPRRLNHPFGFRVFPAIP